MIEKSMPVSDELVRCEVFKTREEWENARTTIGGSDASSVIGLNPYKTNTDLFDEKLGIKPLEDISEKPYVKYGNDAENLLRELFALDYPNLKVFYLPFNMYKNERYPFAHYSADGMLEDEKGRTGILEIKTTNILQSQQKENWKERIPENYYVQCLHGMMVTEAEFVVLKAQLKSEFEGQVYLQTKHYTIERKDVEEDIAYLEEKEREFWESMETNRKPAMILPNL